MHPYIKAAVMEALKGTMFRKTVDLGSGAGDGGELLSPYTGYLIGVDMDPNALKVAADRGLYDELVHGDIRTFKIPWDVDSVFLFDSIEHLSKEEGYALLERCSDRCIMLTTPWWSLSLLSPWQWDGHQCVWTAEELRERGFTTEGYSYFPDLWSWLWWGGFTLACYETRF